MGGGGGIESNVGYSLPGGLSFKITRYLFAFFNGLCIQIKAEEARDYKDAVGWEYEALLKKLVDAKQEYLKVS